MESLSMLEMTDIKFLEYFDILIGRSCAEMSSIV